MTDQQRRFALFVSLHRPGEPLILFNVWDAGSARSVAQAGAPAIATGSWSVAAAHGLTDGEMLPLDVLGSLGVARISHGPAPYRTAAAGLGADAARLYR